MFKRFSDRSGIGTHLHIRVPEFSTQEFLESGAFDRSGILPGFRRHFSFSFVPFDLDDILSSEIFSAKLFAPSISKGLRLNPRVLSFFTCLG